MPTTEYSCSTINLARCNAHLLRGTLREKSYGRIASEETYKCVVIQASGILSTEIGNCSAKRVLGGIEGAFWVLIKDAISEAFCVPFHSYTNRKCCIESKKTFEKHYEPDPAPIASLRFISCVICNGSCDRLPRKAEYSRSAGSRTMLIYVGRRFFVYLRCLRLDKLISKIEN